MEEIMTDKQFKTILEMFGMILDGCKDIEEAKEKVQKLLDEKKERPEQQAFGNVKGGRACHRSPTKRIIADNKLICQYYDVRWELREDYNAEDMGEDMACDWDEPESVREIGEYNVAEERFY